MRRAFALALLALAGCDSATDPGSSVVGSYEAVEWTIVSSTTNHDLVASGGHLDLVLAADGTTSGEFFVPAGSAPAPQEQRVSLSGTWERTGDVVTFDMPGDTYVRLVDWVVVDDELRNEFVNGGFTVTTRLRR